MTQYEAGPSCTQALALLGADVVKVEPPTGDPARVSFATGEVDSQYFMNYNGNKRSLAIDLTKPEGREIFLKLVPKFNVFVENFGPGVIERLNIGYDVLGALNPGLIYARIKGFGLSGPYANFKVFDPLAQAAAGTFSVTGHPDGPPTQPSPTLADTGTGIQTALAITAAYVEFLRTGKGQAIEVSMQEATLSFMKTRPVMEWHADHPTTRKDNLAQAPTGMFPCAGGGANDFIYLTVGTTRMLDVLFITIDRPDLVDEPRFATRASRAAPEAMAELREVITGWTMQHTKHEAMMILGEAGVPCSAIFDTVDVWNDPHLNQRNFFTTVDHPEAGKVRLMTLPTRMRGSAPVKRAPLRGEHSIELLKAELGLNDADLTRLCEEKVVVAHD
jgi:formyl-CoA transferase